jgi:inorganic pyrophosphatase
MAKRKKNSLANPMLLAPRDAEDDAIIQVIIETPKGSRNKYAFDADQKVFELTKVLPAGMAFPYDFGFIPSTLARGRRSNGRASSDGRTCLSRVPFEVPCYRCN